ncbi:MAG: hypothetical protein ACOCUT_03840, partial [bacterium]
QVSWFTKVGSPMIKFTPDREIDSCKFYPNASDVNLDIPITLVDGSFVVDLSTIDFADVNSSNAESEVMVSCIYPKGGNVLAGSNSTFFVKYLGVIPDYVAQFSDGRVFVEAPFTAQIRVRSVSYPFMMNCEYAFDCGEYRPLFSGYKSDYTASLDLNSLSDGEHDFNLRCTDVLGVYGPEKSYKFEVNRNADLEIKNMQLSVGNDVFEAIVEGAENIIYVSTKQNFMSEVELNMRNGVECSFNHIPDSGNPFSGIFGFFDSFLGIGDFQGTLVENSYYFESSESFNLQSDSEDVLRVICDNGDSEVDENYRLVYLNGSAQVDVSLS